MTGLSQNVVSRTDTDMPVHGAGWKQPERQPKRAAELPVAPLEKRRSTRPKAERQTYVDEEGEEDAGDESSSG